MDSCLFCQIVDGKIKAEIVDQNDLIVAFKDIHPKAPVHVLIVPKIHRERPSELTAEEITAMLEMANKIAQTNNIKKTGYRLVFNVGAHAGQEIDHVHLHLIGGTMAKSMY